MYSFLTNAICGIQGLFERERGAKQKTGFRQAWDVELLSVGRHLSWQICVTWRFVLKVKKYEQGYCVKCYIYLVVSPLTGCTTEADLHSISSFLLYAICHRPMMVDGVVSCFSPSNSWMSLRVPACYSFLFFENVIGRGFLFPWT